MAQSPEHALCGLGEGGMGAGAGEGQGGLNALIAPKLSRERKCRENRQEQLGNAPVKGLQMPVFFQVRGGKEIQQNIWEFIWKGSESPW